MAHAATTTTPLMNRILLSLPDYGIYESQADAMNEEILFREALSLLLQEMAGRLMSAAEQGPRTRSMEHQSLIEDGVEDLAVLVTHLERSGTLRLAGPVRSTGRELRCLDHKLIMLLEHAWKAVAGVLQEDPEIATKAGEKLDVILQAFAELAESRNQLLGLGWESEFGMRPMTGRRHG